MILVCDYLDTGQCFNSTGTVPYAVQGASNFKVCGSISCV